MSYSDNEIYILNLNFVFAHSIMTGHYNWKMMKKLIFYKRKQALLNESLNSGDQQFHQYHQKETAIYYVGNSVTTMWRGLNRLTRSQAIPS